MNQFARYFNWTKQFIITLRFSILALFFTLLTTVVLVITLINYISTSRTISDMANQLMRSAANASYEKFSLEIDNTMRDTKLTAQLISEGVLNKNNFLEMQRYFYDFVKKQTHIVHGAHWSDEKGNFILAQRTVGGNMMTVLLDRNRKIPLETKTYYDSKGKIIKREKISHPDYDPRKRFWYLYAKGRKKPLWTSVYPFLEGFLGITISDPIYDKNGKLEGVLGSDIAINWLSAYIQGQKISPNSREFIATETGQLVAYSKPGRISYENKLTDINAIKHPWVSRSFELYKKNKQSTFSFKMQGEQYFAYYQKMPSSVSSSENWLIGVVTPKKDFIGKAEKTIIINALISLSTLILGGFLMSRLVLLIVEPIKRLVQETQKIKTFDLEGNPNIFSRIKEIILLSEAFNSMKQGLKAFCSYIPMTLVRQLIKTGEGVHIGGSKKNLVIFFTDIEGFTPLAHQMDADMLMKQLCFYFDDLTHIISQEQGTIDKYIGDSIMAFWGAPFPVEKPCYHAATAALICIEHIARLNEEWAKKGKPSFHTRIGIHMGEAIIGNIGSSERINYTVLGDTVNLANRLEGVNKKYKTNIIVSEIVYQEIKGDFELRYLGEEELKGIAGKEKIYELVAKKSRDDTP